MKKQKPREYWTDVKVGKREAQKAMKREGWEVLPSGEVLKRHGYSLLAGAISRNYGGYPQFRKELGQATSRKNEGYWKKIDNVLKECRTVMRKRAWKNLPSSTVLEEKGYFSLVKAIVTHGGFTLMRQKLGQEQLRRKRGAWISEAYTIEEALRTMKENDWRDLPSSVTLVERGYHNLAGAINRYHQGFPIFRNKLRQITGHHGVVESSDQLITFLKENPPAHQLAVAASMMNGEATDLEQVILATHRGTFRDHHHLHSLLEESKEEIYGIVSEGMTNLGAYIGEFSLTDRTIIPLLIGQALSGIAESNMNGYVIEKLVRVLRNSYGPRFNDNPKKVVRELEVNADSSNEVVREIYQKLYQHYQQTLALQKELN